MLSALSEFGRRHKGKLLSVALVAGGAGLLSRYAAHKLDEWQRHRAEAARERHSRKSHYERSLEVTRATLVRLLPRVRRMIARELDSETLLAALADHPDDKMRYWEELKLVAFGRAVCTVLCCAVVTPMTHVVMLTLAAHTTQADDLPGQVQAEYLKILEDIIEQQLPKLVKKTMLVLSGAVSTLPLNSALTLPQLATVFERISALVMNSEEGGENLAESILPLSRYVMDPVFELSVEDSCKFKDMYYFTVDVFGTQELQDVSKALLSVGCDYILDCVSPLYLASQAPDDGVRSVHLLKLIPALNNVLQAALPLSHPYEEEELEYVNRLCVSTPLEELAFSVYDSLAA